MLLKNIMNSLSNFFIIRSNLLYTFTCVLELQRFHTTRNSEGNLQKGYIQKYCY